MVSAVRRVVNAWEAYQVELHGRYSRDQLSELARYERETSSLRAFAVVALTPLSCIVILLGADLMPLKSAYLGLEQQGLWYWIRVVYTAIMVGNTSLTQFSHASPSLSLPISTVGLASLIIAPVVAVSFLVMHVVIGFPTPFSYSLEAGPFQATLFSALWILWASRLRGDSEARQDVIRFGTFWLSQVGMLISYPAMTFMFRTLDGNIQTLLSLSLPFVKMAIKNWATYGVYRVEQYTPVCVVFSVDVFHALFVSCAMQSSTTLGTLGVVMAVDIFQSFVAYYEIRQTLRRLQGLGHLIDRLEKADAKPGPHLTVSTTDECQPTLRRAVDIMSADSQVGDHPQVKLPRHRGGIQTRVLRFESTRVTTAHRDRHGQSPSITIIQSGMLNRITKWAQSQRKVHVATQETKLTKLDQAKLYYVLETMQLFYMVEFYLLIELTEVFVTVIYSIYLGVMFYLPNRFNYSHLKALSDDQYISTLEYLLQYAAYELLSLLALAFVFRSMLRVSPLHQLGFTLEKNWRLAQALLVLCVFFPVQLSLDHTGNDYTMTFAWLGQNNTPS